LYSKCFAIALQ
jgi:hypothetical protein